MGVKEEAIQASRTSFLEEGGEYKAHNAPDRDSDREGRWTDQLDY